MFGGGCASHQAVDVLPDSAIQKSGKPFFIPSFSEHFVGRTMVGAHINRLGKNIAGKFAGRYYNQLCLCLQITAADALKELRANQLPWALATAFDASLIQGEDFPKEDLGESLVIKQSNATGEAVASAKGIYERLDSAIEYLSRYFTLKIGDIVLVDAGLEPVKMTIDDKIICTVNDNESIHIKVK